MRRYTPYTNGPIETTYPPPAERKWEAARSARLPAPSWLRRQWLGIDPPGPLFRVEIEGVPLYHAVREAVASTDHGLEKAVAMLERVADAERTAALVDLRLAALDLFDPIIEPLLQKPLPDRGDDGRAWAIEIADRLLALFAPGAPKADRGNQLRMSTDVSRAAFVSLVRARVPIEPRWDPLLTLEPWMPREEREACILAIPVERREAAIAHALSRIFFDGPRVQVALELLPQFPFVCVAACILDGLENARDAELALDAVRAAAKSDRAILDVLKPLEKKLAKAAKLRVKSRTRPITEAALDATATKQLEAANRKYGGHKATTKELFAAEAQRAGEMIMPSLTEKLVLEDDKGKHVYDAWLYRGDSGTVFKAGTTTTVAEVVQGSLECKSLALKLALKAALQPSSGGG